MNLREYQLMYQAEDRLWWYKGMEAITRAVLERNYYRGGELKILDAGCGTGGVIKYLADYGHVTGLDISPYALQFSQKRGHFRLTCGSVVDMPFKTASFDLVTSFDVLDAKGIDDEKSLGEFVRVLLSGGRVFLRLPAYDWLRGAHDRAVQTGHRYTIKEVRAKLEAAGLLIEHLSYANMCLFPLAVLKRWSEPFLPLQADSDLSIDFGFLNGLFKTILSSEGPLLAQYKLPFGLTVVAVARKP